VTDEPDSLTLRYLRRLDEKIDRLTDQVTDLSADVRGIKSHMAGFMQNEVAQDGAIASIKQWLDRIERRLDLQETRP
jgi:D-serine deaminase-like pyridoxal phosphate-dependent protein